MKSEFLWLSRRMRREKRKTQTSVWTVSIVEIADNQLLLLDLSSSNLRESGDFMAYKIIDRR